MTFAAPTWFWGLLVLPVLVILFVRAERRAAQRLREFVAPRLLPQLTASVDRFRRATRFALILLALAFALVALAQPRWGYSFEDVKRKGIDLLIAVDTSRSMLSNDVQPNRLQRVKLAALDLITELQGDRVGLIAFAGRAFLQAPLTIDYDAAVEAINDLDTKTIPEGGTNISEAINLASRTYGKSAVGNRALIIFTDGEELSGDALKAAKTAAEAGIRIFTIGVGSPQGSLIPLPGESGGTAFVKDSKGQVVKSKLDEKRLQEIAQTTGGFYLHLENGPRTMHQLFTDGLAQITAKEMDVRSSRQPIERYEWPLAVATLALATSILITERKRTRVGSVARGPVKLAPAAVAAVVLLSAGPAFSAVTGLNFYRDGKYAEAYRAFQDDLKAHPDSPDKDKMQFDAGAAAYQMRDYDKAAEAFSQALLTPDQKLQEHSHYNMGRTLEERADMAKSDESAITDLENALGHYQDVLKLNPNNPGAKANAEEVKKKIERLKKKKKEKPTPPPQQQQKKDKNQQDQKGGGGGSSNENQQQQSQQDQKQDKQDQNQQQQQSQANNQQGSNQNQQQKDQQDQLQAKNDKKPEQQPDAGPSPSPSNPQSSGSPSPSPGDGKEQTDNKSETGKDDNQPSPSPGEGNEPQPSPSPGESGGAEGSAAASPTPAPSPQKKFAGEIKGASPEQSPPPDQPPQMVDAEPEKEGEMSERQARMLLQAMKNEEARVQLDERRAARHVYNDW